MKAQTSPRRGRPRTSPLTRIEQVRAAKRAQRERERAAGVRAVSFKLGVREAERITGDTGRRGYTQNVLDGPVPDDAFGGPEPDNAHLTGVILRLIDDGTTPRDNPFYKLGKRHGGRDDDDDDDDDDKDRAAPLGPLAEEVRKNLQRMFAYGVRNSFGMNRR